MWWKRIKNLIAIFKLLLLFPVNIDTSFRISKRIRDYSIFNFLYLQKEEETTFENDVVRHRLPRLEINACLTIGGEGEKSLFDDASTSHLKRARQTVCKRTNTALGLGRREGGLGRTRLGPGFFNLFRGQIGNSIRQSRRKIHLHLRHKND